MAELIEKFLSMGLGIMLLFMIWPLLSNLIDFIPQKKISNSEIDDQIDTFLENLEKYAEKTVQENETFEFQYSGLISIAYSENLNGSFICKFRFVNYANDLGTYSDVSYRSVHINNVEMIEVNQIFVSKYEIYKKNGSTFLTFF